MTKGLPERVIRLRPGELPHRMFRQQYDASVFVEECSLDELLSEPLHSLGLPIRTVNSLEELSVDTVGKLLQLKPQDLLNIRNCGPRTLYIVFEACRECGLLPAATDLDMKVKTVMQMDRRNKTQGETVKSSKRKRKKKGR